MPAGHSRDSHASAVPVILGFQLLLQAIVLDIENVPN